MAEESSLDLSCVPAFLQSVEHLRSHLDEHFAGLTTTAKGDAFATFALQLVAHTDVGARFGSPTLSPTKSHDRGVDLLTAETDQGDQLCGQAKFAVTDKGEFDQIMSKFQGYESDLARGHDREPTLFPRETTRRAKPTFVVVTASSLSRILSLYEQSALSSRSYYETLKAEQRVTVVDAPQILDILRRLYQQAHLVPAEVVLTSEKPWIAMGNVWLGILRGSELLDLHATFGDAIFFENIRDFLGVTSGKKVEDRVTVNQEIIKTIQTAPDKMLERNNGVTFRAAAVSVDDTRTRLVLSNGAIVNGCQTTMCLVRERGADACVACKVVRTPDAWDIAKAANYQNPVTRIELDMASYLRPQLAKKAAADHGYALESATSGGATQILNTIHRKRVDYEELRHSHLGLFSRKPNNLFEGNYTEVRQDILDAIYREPGTANVVFETLFLILSAVRRAVGRCEETFSQPEYASLFRRLLDDAKPKYRAYLAVLAVCGTLRDNLSNRDPDSGKEAARTRKTLDMIRDVLENEPRSFESAFLCAFEVLADTALETEEALVQQEMYTRIARGQFDSFYKKVLMRIDRLKAG